MSRRIVSRVAMVAFVVLVAAAAVHGQQGPTQADLVEAGRNTRDWLVSNHDYSGQRFVELDLIDRDNVESLRPVCLYQTGYSGPFHTNPLVYDGMMYLTAGTSTMAIDAVTCTEHWRHEWQAKAKENFPMQRGVAIKDGMVVRGSLDGYLFALNASSGDLVWETPAADPETGASFTMPPVIFDDLILIGPGGTEAGVRGWVGAFRLADGAPVWKFNTVPLPGEPGSETWSDPASPLIGGGAVWTVLSLDAETGTVYAPVANPAPDFYDVARLGDNLYTSSMVALDVRTGELQWYYQAVPHDLHDWDLTQSSPLFSAMVQGRRRDLVTVVGKDGILHLLDRDTHEHLWEVPVTRRENTAAPVTPEGVRACPGYTGGVEWNGPAYNPGLNMLYTPAVDWCGTFTAATEFLGRNWLGGLYTADPFDDARGMLTAVDASTGDVRWRYGSGRPMLAAITTTSAGLLFTAEMTGDFLVLDAESGEELFRFNTGAPNNGGAAIYAIDGKQYVALMSGNTSPIWATEPAAGTVNVFGLP